MAGRWGYDRGHVSDLRIALSERGLRAALESLCATSSLAVELDVTDDDLPDNIAAAAYFVAAELLANTARYAQASKVAVRVTPRAGELHVVVADDGVGGADAARGTGLSGLADRVEVLKGCLDVDSPPGGGTRVHALIPLAA